MVVAWNRWRGARALFQSNKRPGTTVRYRAADGEKQGRLAPVKQAGGNTHVMFDELVGLECGSQEDQQGLGGYSLHPESCRWLSWSNPDPDPPDLNAGFAEGHAGDFMITAPPPPPPATAAGGSSQGGSRQPPRLIQQGNLTQPHAIPKQVAVFKEEALRSHRSLPVQQAVKDCWADWAVAASWAMPGLGRRSSIAPPPAAPKTPAIAS